MKPILFSTPMVQAILDGRKTMTRRVIKVDDDPENWKKSIAGTSIVRTTPYDVKLPRYAVGNVLWVRETWALQECEKCQAGIPALGGECKCDFVYRANYGTTEDDSFPPLMFKWRPSIHMPREAARIFLRVTDVRVERLQEILCGDMKREGCIPPTVTGGQYQQWQRDYWIPLWDAINAKRGYGWNTNPWVWVIEFERTEKPKE